MKMIWIIALAVTAAVTIVPSGCTAKKEVTVNNESTAQQVKLEYRNIAPEEAKKRLGEEKGIILLDVRTKEEYAEKHIPGSKLIPVDTLETEALAKLPDKNSTIFVYCRSGRRSVTASEILVKLGYAKVYNLGGIIDWKYETESGEYKY